MAVKGEYESIETFEDWYTKTSIDHRTGALVVGGFTACAVRRHRQYNYFKSEMDQRVGQYEKYEKQAAAEVVSKKTDLPNISSGENAGFIRRIARNVVQHTPNVFIANEFEDDNMHGILARHLLKTKVIGDDQYSNDMQQNLITTARRGFAIGFDCVVPVLQQDKMGKWYIQYDNIHYRDVFPEPGTRDIRRAEDVYVRRWIPRGFIHRLIQDQPKGWDISALKALFSTTPSTREYVDHENKKHSYNPEVYEVITWYSATGDAFLTWDARSKMLLRIEKNKHPLKEHPVFFFIPEKDDQQPYGKSLLSLTFGRQEFQDLFLNGAMKLWWRNINPPIIGYGTVNAIPNLSPGKYTQISNPNAKVEAFEVNTNALMMFGQTSQQNAANMVQLLGAADQQMAAQSTGGMMSQTPAGVDAQQQMVDITTNNYQKAMEQFFSRYCSYALTIYFQELKGTKSVTPSADVRKELLDAGMAPEVFHHSAYTDDQGVKHPADNTGLKDGAIEVDFSDMATVYYVQCVPGSLVELEDEKQLRILNELFIPLSQSMNAIAASGDQEAMKAASATMRYIMQKQIELSGSAHASELKKIFGGQGEEATGLDDRISKMEMAIGGSHSLLSRSAEESVDVLVGMNDRIQVLTEAVSALLERQGVPGPGGQNDPSAAVEPGVAAQNSSLVPV